MKRERKRERTVADAVTEHDNADAERTSAVAVVEIANKCVRDTRASFERVTAPTEVELQW